MHFILFIFSIPLWKRKSVKSLNSTILHYLCNLIFILNEHLFFSTNCQICFSRSRSCKGTIVLPASWVVQLSSWLSRLLKIKNRRDLLDEWDLLMYYNNVGRFFFLLKVIYEVWNISLTVLFTFNIYRANTHKWLRDMTRDNLSTATLPCWSLQGPH